MYLLHRFGSTAYKWATGLAAIAGHRKARARVRGVRRQSGELPQTAPGLACYWMHCASVGEFEQGRPVWDALRLRDPDARFVLTFFSASGYEVFSRKPEVGEVYYLPWDNAASAKTFVGRLDGEGGALRLSLFVKYEWWLGFHRELVRLDRPYVIVSAAFRQNQPFFRAYGTAWRAALQSAAWVFVQDERSERLLSTLGLHRYSRSGDTRLDRVMELPAQSLDEPGLRVWTDAAAADAYTLVAGSTWPADEQLLADVLAHSDIRLLLAPHEVNEEALRATAARFRAHGVERLSQLTASSAQARVVVVDCIGLLSRLYRLGDAAYVGGGFGAGIHNILEPLAYRLPIAFGPKHGGFPEASALVRLGIATSVTDGAALRDWLKTVRQAGHAEQVLAKAEAYMTEHCGATQRVMGRLASLGLTPSESA